MHFDVKLLNLMSLGRLQNRKICEKKMFVDLSKMSPSQQAMHQQAIVLETSMRHAARVEAERIAFAEREKYQAELEIESEKHLAETRREREAEQKRLREESNKNLEVELKERFFRANPNALESDYNRVKDRLKDAHFIEQMKSEATTEEIIRNSGSYGAM